MKTMGLKGKFYISIISLFVLVFLVWILFFLGITGYIRTSMDAQINNTANRIMDELGDEFVHMEQLVFSLTQNATVKDFVIQKDVTTYYNMAPNVRNLLGSTVDFKFIRSVILYNQDGAYYRFYGTLGNTTCERINTLINTLESPGNLVVQSEGTKLIGYGSKIMDRAGNKIGAVVILVDEEMVLSRLRSYNLTSTLHAAVAARGEIVISNTPNMIKAEINQIKNTSHYYTQRHIGITPFDILVWADSSYLNAATLFFTIAAVITAVAFGLIFLLFAAMTSKTFLIPMLSVMESVEKLDINVSPSSIPGTSSAELNRLIGKINDMLERIDTKNKDMQRAQERLQNAEIEQQKAIIYSLKKQINAHFTVNIINIIRILISKKDLARAKAMCDGLSALIRYAHDEDEYINAWDEFSVLQTYIDIMNIRYENKLIVNLELDDRLMDYKIPRMLLQPIVENAIVHGYRNSKQNCSIDIDAHIEGEKIAIAVRDEGEGMSSAALDDLKCGIRAAQNHSDQTGGIENIALRNIHRRIVSYYGSAYGLDIRKGEKRGLQVFITLGKNVSL